MFQLYNLLPVLTAERNVDLPLLLTKLSIAAGFTAAMQNSGSPSRAIVMRSGADSEMTSGLSATEVDVIKQAPGLRRDGQVPVASAEYYAQQSRALGFNATSVVVSVLAESLALAAIGGALGGVGAYLAFNGYQTSTMNFSTFSQVAFAFQVTPRLLVMGLIYALAMGLVGGLFPAVRAARTIDRPRAPLAPEPRLLRKHDPGR